MQIFLYLVHIVFNENMGSLIILKLETQSLSFLRDFLTGVEPM